MPELAPFQRAPVTVSTGACLKTDPTSLLSGAAQGWLGSKGETEGRFHLETPFISVRSFGELLETGASLQVHRQPWGGRVPTAHEELVSLEVSLRHGLELAAGERTVPALYSSAAPAAWLPGSRAALPPAQPSVAMSFPRSLPSSAWGCQQHAPTPPPSHRRPHRLH